MEEDVWIKSHFNEIKEEYQGKYLAISRDRVIASGSTAKEVLEKIDNENLKDIRFIHIPKSERYI